MCSECSKVLLYYASFAGAAAHTTYYDVRDVSYGSSETLLIRSRRQNGTLLALLNAGNIVRVNAPRRVHVSRAPFRAVPRNFRIDAQKRASTLFYGPRAVTLVVAALAKI